MVQMIGVESEDIFNCGKCSNPVMPWHVFGCEGCGCLNPATWQPEPELWTCGVCGDNDIASQEDAEQCCAGGDLEPNEQPLCIHFVYTKTGDARYCKRVATAKDEDGEVSLCWQHHKYLFGKA